MFKPYSRIILMHIAILGVGALYGSKTKNFDGILLAIILITLKTVIDAASHISQNNISFRNRINN